MGVRGSSHVGTPQNDQGTLCRDRHRASQVTDGKTKYRCYFHLLTEIILPRHTAYSGYMNRGARARKIGALKSGFSDQREKYV